MVDKLPIIVVLGDDWREFQANLNAAVKEGYGLYGSPLVTPEAYYRQLMVLRGTETNVIAATPFTDPRRDT